MASGKLNNKELVSLLEFYSNKKSQIKKRLKEFRAVWTRPDKEIFNELCFCVCTPQSKAVYCDKAIKALVENGMLYKGDIEQIRKELKAVRFPNNKAKFLFEARKHFLKKGQFFIKEKVDVKDILGTREWFAKNIKGIGLKEASHFLRNIGWGADLAILDVHILKNMLNFGVIKEKPRSLTDKNYELLEKLLRKFSADINVPLGELDILFWCKETGIIFK